MPVIGPSITKLEAELDVLLASQTSGAAVAVTYHEPAPPEPTPAPSGTAAVWVHAAVADEATPVILLPGDLIEIVSCDGAYGTWKGVARQGGILISRGGDPVVLRTEVSELPIIFTVAGRVSERWEPRSRGRRSCRSRRTPSWTWHSNRTITVNGSRMTIAFDPTLEGFGPLDLPIEPAPVGRCPSS